MPGAAIWVGVLLMLLGIVSYAASGGASLTAFIPSAVGLALAALGALARRESARKHAMHAAAVLAVLGVVGSVPGIVSAVQMLAGGEVARPGAAVAQSVMAVLCAVFVALAVRSFVAARRSRSS